MPNAYPIGLIFAVLIHWLGASISSAEESGESRERKIQQLVDAALDPPPSSGDLTIIRNTAFQNKTIDEALMRKNIENVLKSLPKEITHDEAKIQQEVEENLARAKREATRPRQFKEHIRWDSTKYRLDQTIAAEGKSVDDKTGFDRTYCNNGNLAANDFSNFTYDVPTKNASHDDRPGSQHEHVDGEGLYGMDQIIRRVIALSVAEAKPVKEPSPSIVFVPIRSRIQAIIDGTYPNLKVSIEKGTWHDQVADHVTLLVSDPNGDAASPGRIEAWLEPNDYRKVYHWECFGRDKRKLVDLTKDRMDSAGLAHSLKREVVNKDGSVLKEEIVVLNGCLGCPVPAETFVFDPPKGFFVVDFRGSKPVIESGPMTLASRAGSVRSTGSFWLVAVNLIVIAGLATFFAAKRLRKSRERSQA